MIRQLRGLRSDDVLCSRPARSHPAHDLTDDLFYVFEKNKRFCDRRERNRLFFSKKSPKCFEKRIKIQKFYCKVKPNRRLWHHHMKTPHPNYLHPKNLTRKFHFSNDFVQIFDAKQYFWHDFRSLA